MTRVVTFDQLRRLRPADKDASLVHDSVELLLPSLRTAVDGLTPRFRTVDGTTSTTIRAHVGDLVLYDVTQAVPVTVVAPASPQLGDMFSIKNWSSGTAAAFIDGNGETVEGHTGSFTTATRALVSGDGLALGYVFTPKGWCIIGAHLFASSSGGGSTSGVTYLDLVPNGNFSSGTVETVMGSFRVPSGTFSSAHGMFGNQFGGDTTTVRLRQFSGTPGQGNIILSLTGSGNVNDVPSTGSVVFPATGFYDLTCQCSSASGSSIIEGLFLAT